MVKSGDSKPAFARRLPAAIVKIWVDGRPLAADRAQKLAGKLPGVHLAAAGTWILPPSAGQPAVFDRAIRLGQGLLAALHGEIGQGRSRALVLPGAIVESGKGIELLPDALLAELERHPPGLPPDALHLTGHAAHGLEARWATARSESLVLASGRQVPTAVLGPPAPGLPPWRNPDLLARALRWVPRPEASEALAEALSSPAARLTGPLGVGKTRLAWEVLNVARRSAVWRRTAGTPGEVSPTPIQSLLRAETKRPLWLIYDSLESAEPGVWNEIGEIAARPDFGKGVHLLLVARSATDWPDPFARAPEVALGPLQGEAWERFCFQVFHGLALPLGVAERLAERAAGNPFALEEALLFLVRDRQLRQVFGSFFFSGTEARAEFQPSSRFRLHAEAEAARLGDPAPVRFLALAEAAVPLAELRAAAFAAGAPPSSDGWDRRWIDAGLLVEKEGPWGEGLAHAIPAVELALGAGLPDEIAAATRRTLGELLAARSSTADELWGAWPLLSGVDEGARLLIAAAQAPASATVPREALFAALRSELAAAGERTGDPELELDLLWALLPLARRLGRLHELETAIRRGVQLARSHPERLLAIAAVAAELDQKSGKFREAEQTLRQALAAARDADDHKKEVLLIELGRVLARQGRRAEAKDLFEKSAWIAEHAGRLAVVATCRFHLGNIALSEHRLDEATRLQQAAIDGRRSLGVGGVAAPLSALGAIALADGNFSKAIESFRAAEAEQTSEAAGVDTSYILLGLGRALTGLGDYAAAAPIYKQALSLREGLDDIVGEAIARIAVAESHLDLGQLDAALSEARKALFSLSLVAEVEARADAERVLGKVLLRQRRPEEADARFAEAERILRATDGDRDLLVVLSLRLDAAIASGRAPAVERAMSALEQERKLRPEVPTTPFLELRLWRGAEWLGGHGAGQRDPLQHLRRAYDELLRQTGFLAPDLRQRFLSQVPDNAAILDAATRAGLSMPVL